MFRKGIYKILFFLLLHFAKVLAIMIASAKEHWMLMMMMENNKKEKLKMVWLFLHLLKSVDY